MRGDGSVDRSAYRWWRSATLAAWGTQLLPLVSALIVLPLLLRSCAPAMISAWLLMTGIERVWANVALGISRSGARLLAENLTDPVRGPSIAAEVGRICRRLAMLWWLLIAPVVGLALLVPFSHLESAWEGWLSWALLWVGSGLVTRSLAWRAWSEGADRVAAVNHIESVTGLLGLIMALMALQVGGGVAGVVAGREAGRVLAVIGQRRLAYRDLGIATTTGGGEVWQHAWRHLLGYCSWEGWKQGTLVTISHVTSPATSAAVMLAVRLQEIAASFAGTLWNARQAWLIRLRKEGDHGRLRDQACWRSFGGTALLAMATIVGWWLVPVLLHLIGSRTAFVDVLVWHVLGIGYLLERAIIQRHQWQLVMARNQGHLIWLPACLLGIAATAAVVMIAPLWAFPAGMVSGTMVWSWWFLHTRESEPLDRQFSRRVMIQTASAVVVVIVQFMLCWVVSRAG